MADVFTKEERSRVMAAVHSRGNKATELKFAAILHASGLKGWRRHQPLPGKPDFVFRRERVAVFVDGCFWHACRWHLRLPRDNRAYWQRKVSRNAARDRAVNKALRKAGWRVLRVWEHSLRWPDAVAKRMKSELRLGQRRGKDTRQ